MKTKSQVLKLVRQQLEKVHVGDIAINLVGTASHTKDDFWYVPVMPSAVPPRMIEYYDALAEVETELSLKHKLRVLLVPDLPDDESTRNGK